MEKIFCELRKAWVAATPEEKIRQAMVRKMIQLGYPPSHISIEISLAKLPHLANKNIKIPSRRADIICFASGIHPQFPLYPLLLVECKAVPLTQKAVSQATGYNHFLQSYFIALANGQEIKTGWYAAEGFILKDGFLTYSEMLEMAKSLSRMPLGIYTPA